MLKGFQSQQPELMDAPIPGQSLTDAPGGQPWERPPEIVNPEEAIAHTMNKVMEHRNLSELISLMDAGVSVEALVEVMAFGGFVTGKWTPDVAELIKPALFVQFMGLAQKAGIKVIATKKPQKKSDGHYEIRKSLKPESLVQPEQPELPLEEDKPGGFLGMEG